VKLLNILLVAALALMVAANIFLAHKIALLTYEIEKLNRAYLDAIESFGGVAETIDSLPPLPEAAINLKR
jgi:hypothetical protein